MKPVSFDDLYPGRFIKGETLCGKPRTYQIKDIARETIEGSGGDKSDEAIVTLKGESRKWVMNVTNARCIKAMFGPMLANWVGKRVTLFPKRGVWFGEEGVAIRVAGSPDIDADLTINLKVSRSKSVPYTLKCTRPNGPKPDPPPESEQGPMTDEELAERY